MKCRIWQNLHILKNSYLLNMINTKNVIYRGNYIYF